MRDDQEIKQAVPQGFQAQQIYPMIHAAALLIISQQRLRHLAAQAGQLRVLFRGQPGLLRLIGEIPEAEEAIPPRRPVI